MRAAVSADRLHGGVDDGAPLLREREADERERLAVAGEAVGVAVRRITTKR